MPVIVVAPLAGVVAAVLGLAPRGRSRLARGLVAGGWGALAAVILARGGPDPGLTPTVAVAGWIGLGAVAACWGGIAVYDACWQIIPDGLSYPAAAGAAAVVGSEAIATGRFPVVAVCAAAGIVLIYCALAIWASMGWGDVKLGISLGLMLGAHGWQTAVAGLFCGTFLVGIVAAGYLLAGRRRDDFMPLGPFLLAGGIAALILG